MDSVKTRDMLVGFAMLFGVSCNAQVSGSDFDSMDSMIARTAQVPLCKKNGKDDLRFIYKTPEKYSNYQQEFAKQMMDAFVFLPESHFFCDIQVEVNCEGKAGNYTFSIEPKTFEPADLTNFKQLMALVEKLRIFTFTPAVYLGENVNSRSRFRVMAVDGKPAIVMIPKK